MDENVDKPDECDIFGIYNVMELLGDSNVIAWRGRDDATRRGKTHFNYPLPIVTDSGMSTSIHE
jgi:hypothetical protein